MVWPLPSMVTELKIGDSGPVRLTSTVMLIVCGPACALACASAQLSVPGAPVVPAELVPGSSAIVTSKVAIAVPPSSWMLNCLAGWRPGTSGGCLRFRQAVISPRTVAWVALDCAHRSRDIDVELL